MSDSELVRYFGHRSVRLSVPQSNSAHRMGTKPGIQRLIDLRVGEVYGRRLAVFPPYFIGACFSFATAASKDLSSILITRFFTGFFASAPVSNTGGVLGDIYSPAQRATALAGYAMAVAGGPLLAPIVAGAMLVSDVSWRWTEYVRTGEIPRNASQMMALNCSFR